MVLLPKQWKSRSSPGFEASAEQENPFTISFKAAAGESERRLCCFGAGWSSPVARQAHNLKVAGSNPAPATNKKAPLLRGFFVAPDTRSGGNLPTLSSIVIRALAVVA